jgi:hypothetical protein
MNVNYRKVADFTEILQDVPSFPDYPLPTRINMRAFRRMWANARSILTRKLSTAAAAWIMHT